MKIASYKHEYEVEFAESFDLSPYDAEKTFYVIDKNLFNLYKTDFINIRPANLFILEANEQNKTLETVAEICDKFTNISAKKNAVLVSLGGGIVQDVTGFVANILYRGIRWIFYPTTLLAACDSCIGSKTSLNFKNYKNLFGTFYPPSKIIIVPNCFKTLKQYDLASGLGEIVKFNVMSGVNTIAELEKNLDKLISLDKEIIQKYINNSLSFKKRFIETDEFDMGERVLLNYAHTFGHAIETAGDYKIPHGTAVALGLLVANRVSVTRNILSEDIFKRIAELIKKIINIDIAVDFNKIISAIKNDKKQISDKIRVILLDGNFNLSITYVTEQEIMLAYRYVWDMMSK